MKNTYSLVANLRSIAAEAGENALLQQKKLKVKSKSSYKDLVTSEDLNAERTILAKLKGYGFNILSEESQGVFDKNTGLTFIIDPIDGTTNYSQGHPDWAISIGLKEENKMVAGVVYSPADKKMYWASRGKGAYLNGNRISVSNKRNLRNAFINAAYLDDMDRFQRLMGSLWDESLKADVMGSMAKAFCYVAEGIYAASVGLSSNIWDYAAANIIVEEAGGRVTDFQGRPIDYSKNRENVIVSNSRIHSKILNHIRKIKLEEVVQK